MNIQRLDPKTAVDPIPKLATRLQDAIISGASIGFLPPLPFEYAVSYWQEVVTALEGRGRILLLALTDGEVLGTVQLDMAGRANASHRAQVMFLIEEVGLTEHIEGDLLAWESISFGWS